MPWYNSRESFNHSGLFFPYTPGNENSDFKSVPSITPEKQQFNDPGLTQQYRPGSDEALAGMGYAPGRNPNDLVFDNTNTTCTSSANCWSGYTCSGGRCKRTDEADTTTGEGGGCNDPDKEMCICRTPLCALERKCCSGTTYTRTVARPGGGLITSIQCEPFKDPDDCSDYCSFYWKTYRELAENCEMTDVCDCGECTSISSETGRGECREVNNPPCYCKSKYERCSGDCEQCQSNGSCQKVCDGCYHQCSTMNSRCPCSNIYVAATVSVPACTGGPNNEGCATMLRRKVASICETLGAERGGCSGKDGQCGYAEYNGKTVDCECKKRTETCPTSGAVSSSYCAGFSEEGKTCYDRGNSYVPQENAHLKCVPGSDITLFGKVCEIDDEKDGCNGPPGCPDDKKCNSQTGFCESDTDLEVCNSGLVCNGACCASGSACVPYRKFKVADNCHLQGGTFFAPQGGPTLQVTDTITEESSVCGRAHTHCAVLVNCRTVASHLECGNGLVDMGPAGFSGCPGIPLSSC